MKLKQKMINLKEITYKKISPYKKPDSISGSISISKGINKNTTIRFTSKNNFNTIQPQYKSSNVKGIWNIKEKKNIVYQKQRYKSKK